MCSKDYQGPKSGPPLLQPVLMLLLCHVILPMTTSATTTTTGSATTTPTTARTTTTAPTIVSSTAPSVSDFNYCGHLRLAAATMMTTAGHNSKGVKEGSDETGPPPLLLRR